MIYLDNSATTQPCPACVRAMTEALTDCWGNPSSVYTLGIDAAHRLRQARQAVAAALGAEPDRVFFTSGGTEADNWAILSSAERLGKRGRHIITTAHGDAQGEGALDILAGQHAYEQAHHYA